jgi:hypothetical protein
MEEFFTPQFFTTVGFPAAICVYTLFGIKPSLDKLTDATNALTKEIKERGEKQEHEIACIKDEVKELKFKMNSLEVRRNA